jgi:hypothetical protein
MLPARWPQLNPQLNRCLLLAPNTPWWDWLRTRGGMAGCQIHMNNKNAWDVSSPVLSTLQALTQPSQYSHVHRVIFTTPLFTERYQGLQRPFSLLKVIEPVISRSGY